MLTVTEYDGDEWQGFVIQLLFLRYQADLTEIPDDHVGDGGIEAFASDGCAFQCYAPEGPASFAELAAKHKKKISTDIKKFIKNRELLTELFGDTKIRKWVLVVPNHCSADVVAWCQKKTQEVRTQIPPLPYVSDDFQVVTVPGHDFFALEAAELSRVGALLVEAAVPIIDPIQIKQFSGDHNEWIEKLRLKLTRIPGSNEVERSDLEKDLLEKHLEGENAINYYDGKFPVIADAIRSLKQGRAKALVIDSKTQALTISGSIGKFEAELVETIPALGKQTAITLSYAAVTEWLMVCNLDPKG